MADCRGAIVLAYNAVFHRLAKYCAEELAGSRPENASLSLEIPDLILQNRGKNYDVRLVWGKFPHQFAIVIPLRIPILLTSLNKEMLDFPSLEYTISRSLDVTRSPKNR